MDSAARGDRTTRPAPARPLLPTRNRSCQTSVTAHQKFRQTWREYERIHNHRRADSTYKQLLYVPTSNQWRIPISRSGVAERYEAAFCSLLLDLTSTDTKPCFGIRSRTSSMKSLALLVIGPETDSPSVQFVFVKSTVRTISSPDARSWNPSLHRCTYAGDGFSVTTNVRKLVLKREISAGSIVSLYW